MCLQALFFYRRTVFLCGANFSDPRPEAATDFEPRPEAGRAFTGGFSDPPGQRPEGEAAALDGTGPEAEGTDAFPGAFEAKLLPTPATLHSLLPQLILRRLQL